MVILVTGATGFIGARLVRALEVAGHMVIRASRHATGDGRAIAVDFARDHAADTWRPRLAGVDVVVNAVGILRETRTQRFAALHVAAPSALFDASVQAGVRRVVQVSALGADAGAATAYHRSKKAADDHLASLPIAGAIVQPSLVYGPGGGSARLFDALASLPVIPVPGRGLQRVQPIHVDDLIAALVAIVLADTPVANVQRIALVGPEPLSLCDFLRGLRGALQLPACSCVGVPMPLVRLAAGIATWWPRLPFDRDALAMLERGNTAAVRDTRDWLGCDPRGVAAFVDPDDAPSRRALARLGWLVPMVRASLAFVWIATGIVSLGLYPVVDSLALLARVGVSAAWQPFLLYGAAVLDLALGIATLVAPRRGLWLLQMAIIAGYTAIITWRLPEFWLHPYGPLTKNVPMLALLALLYALEERRR